MFGCKIGLAGPIDLHRRISAVGDDSLFGNMASAYDPKRFGLKMPKEVPMTTTERAYTSPIWYTP